MKQFIIPTILLFVVLLTGTRHAPLPFEGECADGQIVTWHGASKNWRCTNAPVATGSIASGAILLVNSGSCPTGFTEQSSMSGKTLLGTVAGNGDVGGTGGSDNITPVGTVTAPTFTGTPFSSVINHTHTVSITDPGHTHVENMNSAFTGPNVGWSAQDTSTNTVGATAYSTASATTGISASTANPGGGVASITPAGTNSAPAFTGTQFDNRSAFIKVIFCKKD